MFEHFQSEPRVDFDREEEASAVLLYADMLQMAQAMFMAPLGHDAPIEHPPSSRMDSIVFV